MQGMEIAYRNARFAFLKCYCLVDPRTIQGSHLPVVDRGENNGKRTNGSRSLLS